MTDRKGEGEEAGRGVDPANVWARRARVEPNEIEIVSLAVCDDGSISTLLRMPDGSGRELVGRIESIRKAE